MNKAIRTMKPILLGFFLLSLQYNVNAQNKIEGYWLNDNKEAKIQIYKANDGKYYGKIVWLKEPLKNGRPKVDEKNSVKTLQSQPLLGLVILKGLSEEDNSYTSGTIYDPDNGKTYDCKMSLQGKKLAIRGYIGFSLFGRTTVWERAS
jgi:uncharacterized protein (DUF2147 family)